MSPSFGNVPASRNGLETFWTFALSQLLPHSFGTDSMFALTPPVHPFQTYRPLYLTLAWELSKLPSAFDLWLGPSQVLVLSGTAVG